MDRFLDKLDYKMKTLRLQTVVDNLRFLVLLIISMACCGCFTILNSNGNMKIEIITIDSVDSSIVKGHYVYCNTNLFSYSDLDSNISGSILTYQDDMKYYFSVTTVGYLNTDFWFSPSKTVEDTSIIVKMERVYPEQTFPIFYFNHNEELPDTLEYKTKIQSLVNFINSQENYIFRLNGHIDFEEELNCHLDLLRAKYIYNCLIDNGIPKEKLEYQGLGCKPYVIRYENEVSYGLHFGDTLNRAFVEQLLPDIQKFAKKLNRRVQVSICLKS